MGAWAGCSGGTGAGFGDLHLTWWLWEESRTCDIISWRCCGFSELQEGFAPALREGGVRVKLFV